MKYLKHVVMIGLAASVLGCGGLFGPAVTDLQVTPDSCGQWTAVMTVSGDGTVTLSQDGKPVGSWPSTGAPITATGAAVPGSTVMFDAQVGDSDRQTMVNMPAIFAIATLTPTTYAFPPGTPPTFDLDVTTTCASIPNLTYVATASGVNWSSGPTPVALPRTRITLPTGLPTGASNLAVVITAGSASVANTEANFFLGDPASDADGDGYGPEQDCNDHDPHVNPGVDEQPVANHIDDNCDGRIDEGTTAYDDDGDGLSEDQGDCDDLDAGVHPGAAEIGDCRDQNCNGQVDEGVTPPQKDDTYEPDDDRRHAVDLDTSRQHEFRDDLKLVSRDAHDDEWFRFYSDDGDWDAWGIDVAITALPAGSSYKVEIYGDGDAPLLSQTVTKEGPALNLLGQPFKDDSGDYLLHLVPVDSKAPWCPVGVNLWSH